MPVLIPSFATCRTHMTAGELLVAKLLCKFLPDDCLLWYDIATGGKGNRQTRRYPDFILLHPQKGLVFLEVKDWRASTLVRADPRVCTLKIKKNQRDMLENHANPLTQARQASFAVIDQLKTIDCLCNDSGTWQGRLAVPYGWGVVFTHITRADMHSMLGEGVEHIFPNHLLLYKEDLGPEQIPEFFAERIWNMRNQDFPCNLLPLHLNHIRATLFPEIVIPQQISFIPKVATQKEWVRVMDERQERLARNMGEGHRVLHGVAGSGKTLVLVFRAKRLAEVANKPVLVISFTRALAAKLRSMFQDDNGDIPPNIEVTHFHDWCKNQCQRHNAALRNKNLDLQPWEILEQATISGVARGIIPKGQYAGVFIDEGHDFEAVWLKILVQMVDEQTQSLLFVYDRAQSIYQGRRTPLKFPSFASVGIKAQGRTTAMETNYRNTREIADFSRRLIQGHLDKNEKFAEELKPIQGLRSFGIFSGIHPAVKAFASLEQEVQFTIRCLQDWHQRGMRWNVMVVLYPHEFAGVHMALALQQAGIPFLHLRDMHSKSAYDPRQNVLALMTIHSCKGLEFPAVAVLDASFMPEGETADKTSDISRHMRLLYVAATRAREVLLMTLHRDNAVSQAVLTAAQPAAVAA